ncbi:aminotransferase class I/II-fold pyridoxal phosphate-dependent enzyme [Catenovulum sediminis]|uniref:8-amino-7-oxononanoate synthase n=1 Tax=Catenovulum sediminis TaxID=1740262 RepID=A0ABV1RM18_9ALTE
MLPESIKQLLAEKQAKDSYRSRIVCRPHDSYVEVDGKHYVNFSGNDYLGLAVDTKLQQRWGEVQLNSGSTGSPLINGYHPSHQALEETICDWLGFESCLLFTSGFTANSSILKNLMTNKQHTIVQDKLNHASLLDGGKEANAKNIRFQHNNIAHLKKRLESVDNYKLIVTEGIFSMDGDHAPIDEVIAAKRQHDAGVMLDDAHGVGVFGKQGEGSLSLSNAKAADIDIFTATFGKAVGTSGAFVCGSQQLIEYLVNHARGYIYSTSFSPVLAEMTRIAIEKLRLEQWRRDKLRDNITYFKNILAELSFEMTGSDSAIQPIVVGDNKSTLLLASEMRKQGFWVTAIRPPTVPAHAGRIRITLTSLHSHQQIKAMLFALKESCERLKICQN